LVVSFASARRTAGEQPVVFLIEVERNFVGPTLGGRLIRAAITESLRDRQLSFIGGPSLRCGEP